MNNIVNFIYVDKFVKNFKEYFNILVRNFVIYYICQYV